MSFAVFGPGQLIVTSTSAANPSPINIGYAQEFSLDEAQELKELYGQNKYALAVGAGTIKATGKMKAATVSGLAINAAFHNLSFSAGQLIMATGEAETVPASGPYTVTCTNSAHFDTDLGVTYANTGLPMVRVASGPTIGQYSVSAGVYTFAAADEGVAVTLVYAYTSSGTGQTKTIVNTPIGSAPVFQLDYATTYNGSPYYLRLYQCIASKLAGAFKLTDFMMPEIDFSIFANAAGKVYEVSYPQVS